MCLELKDLFFLWDGPKMRQVRMYIHAHLQKM